jgi:hypothetical protein
MKLLWPKTYSQTFQLVSTLGAPHDLLVDKVLTALEIQTLFVPDCHTRLAGPPPLHDGIDCLGDAAVPVELLDWVPVACQEISWGKPSDECEVHYDHNLFQAVLPTRSGDALGPAAFQGRIVLDPRCCRALSPEAFCMVLARALVQVFRVMLVLVPACLNWQRFQAATRRGTKQWQAFATGLSPLLADAGHPDTLAAAQAFWPHTLADQWFQAHRRDAITRDDGRANFGLPPIEAAPPAQHTLYTRVLHLAERSITITVN